MLLCKALLLLGHQLLDASLAWLWRVTIAMSSRCTSRCGWCASHGRRAVRRATGSATGSATGVGRGLRRPLVEQSSSGERRGRWWASEQRRSRHGSRSEHGLRSGRGVWSSHRERGRGRRRRGCWRWGGRWCRRRCGERCGGRRRATITPDGSCLCRVVPEHLLGTRLMKVDGVLGAAHAHVGRTRAAHEGTLEDLLDWRVVWTISATKLDVPHTGWSGRWRERRYGRRRVGGHRRGRVEWHRHIRQADDARRVEKGEGTGVLGEPQDGARG